MSDQVSSLFSLAHSLLTLGQDGSPIYVDSFTRLNRDVYESALNSYGNMAQLLKLKPSCV